MCVYLPGLFISEINRLRLSWSSRRAHSAMARTWGSPVGLSHGVDLGSVRRWLILRLATLGVCVFFFSSIRRHTRLVSDWSSDVCSSDLNRPGRPYGSAPWADPRDSSADPAY